MTSHNEIEPIRRAFRALSELLPSNPEVLLVVLDVDRRLAALAAVPSPVSGEGDERLRGLIAEVEVAARDLTWWHPRRDSHESHGCFVRRLQAAVAALTAVSVSTGGEGDWIVVEKGLAQLREIQTRYPAALVGDARLALLDCRRRLRAPVPSTGGEGQADESPVAEPHPNGDLRMMAAILQGDARALALGEHETDDGAGLLRARGRMCDDLADERGEPGPRFKFDADVKLPPVAEPCEGEAPAGEGDEGEAARERVTLWRRKDNHNHGFGGWHEWQNHAPPVDRPDYESSEFVRVPPASAGENGGPKA